MYKEYNNMDCKIFYRVKNCTKIPFLNKYTMKVNISYSFR